MTFEWCQDPAKVCIFWGVVLVLLVIVLLKLWNVIGEKKKIAEKQTNRQFRQQLPYSGGATQRFAQENETPYLRNCIDYVYDLKADADDKLIAAVDSGAANSDAAGDANSEAAADAAALASTNVDSNVAGIAGTEYMTATSSGMAHDGVHKRTIGYEGFAGRCPPGYVRFGSKCHRNPMSGIPNTSSGRFYTGGHSRGASGGEQMTASNEGPVHWFIGDNITQMKTSVSGQSPELDTNRWTMQIQNQVSDLRSDSVDDYLKEDILFRRNLANM